MGEALEVITLGNGFSFNFMEITSGTYVAYNGIRLTEIGRGYVRGEIDIRPELLNPNGILHGGVLGTLADTTAIFGCVYLYEVAGISTNTLTVSYLKPAKSGKIIASGKVLSQGKNSSQWKVEMMDEGDNMIAFALISFSIKS